MLALQVRAVPWQEPPSAHGANLSWASFPSLQARNRQGQAPLQPHVSAAFWIPTTAGPRGRIKEAPCSCPARADPAITPQRAITHLP